MKRSKKYYFYCLILFTSNIFTQVIDLDEEYDKKIKYFSGTKIMDTFILDDAKPFYNGRAFVKIENKWGVLNQTGNKAYDFVFDDIFYLPYNLNIVIKNNKKYIFNYNECKLVKDTFFDEIEIFNSNFAKVKLNNKYSIINSIGITVFNYVFENLHILNENRAWVKLNNKWSLIDFLGRAILSDYYDDVNDFKNEKSCFVKKNNKWALVNLEIKPEKLYTERVFDEIIYPFYEGIAVVKSISKTFYISEKNVITIPNKNYEELGYICAKNITFIRDKKKGILFYSLINKQEVDLMLPIDDIKPCINGLGWVAQDFKWALINNEGTIKTAFAFQECKSSNQLNIGWVRPIKASGWMLINNEGLCPDKNKQIFSSVNDFKNNMAIVYNNNGCGIIDSKGKIIIPLYYDDLLDFNNSERTFAKYNSKWGIITKRGKRIKIRINNSNK